MCAMQIWAIAAVSAACCRGAHWLLQAVDVLQAMGAMNKQMNLPALSNIMREFDRQNEKMEMTSEMMGDAVDDAFEVCMLCKQCVAAQSQCPFWSYPKEGTCLGTCMPTYNASPILCN